MYKLTVCVLAIMFLAGCAGLQPKPLLLTATAIAAGDCDDLLGYYDSYIDMDSERRKQELVAISETWSLAPDDCKQLRLALLLSQPGSSEKDRHRALKLLADLFEDSGGIPVKSRQLAKLLKEQLQQQQSLQMRVHKLQQKLKQERAVAQLRLKKLTDLQSQLQQLKNIEESINEKEQAIISPISNTANHESAKNPTGR